MPRGGKCKAACLRRARGELMAGHTLFLDLDTWDLTLDSGGGIAVTSGAYGIAQNVANAVRLFTNDAYYDTERGIPHFIVDLGLMPMQAVVRNRWSTAARGVDGVASATSEVRSFDEGTRVLTGVISLETTDGETVDIEV